MRPDELFLVFLAILSGKPHGRQIDPAFSKPTLSFSRDAVSINGSPYTIAPNGTYLGFNPIAARGPISNLAVVCDGAYHMHHPRIPVTAKAIEVCVNAFASDEKKNFQLASK